MALPKQKQTNPRELAEWALAVTRKGAAATIKTPVELSTVNACVRKDEDGVETAKILVEVRLTDTIEFSNRDRIMRKILVVIDDAELPGFVKQPVDIEHFFYDQFTVIRLSFICDW